MPSLASVKAEQKVYVSSQRVPQTEAVFPKGVSISLPCFNVIFGQNLLNKILLNRGA